MRDKGISSLDSRPEGSRGVSRPIRDAALRAGREPIGLWDLMLWAYNAEMVRYTCGSDFRPAGVSQSTMAWAMSAGADGVRYDGPDPDLDFAPCAHEDALGVHGHVLRVIDAQEKGAPRREAFELLILHTEAEAPPTWRLPEPQWKVVPVRREKGKIQHFYGTRHEPLGCLVDCIGLVPGFDIQVRDMAEWREVVDRARVRYRRWHTLLGEVLHSMGPEQRCLTRWRVAGIGAEPVPWAEAQYRAA